MQLSERVGRLQTAAAAPTTERNFDIFAWILAPMEHLSPRDGSISSSSSAVNSVRACEKLPGLPPHGEKRQHERTTNLVARYEHQAGTLADTICGTVFFFLFFSRTGREKGHDLLDFQTGCRKPNDDPVVVVDLSHCTSVLSLVSRSCPYNY